MTELLASVRQALDAGEAEGVEGFALLALEAALEGRLVSECELRARADDIGRLQAILGAVPPVRADGRETWLHPVAVIMAFVAGLEADMADSAADVLAARRRAWN